MGKVTVNITGKPGYSVIAKYRIGEDGTSVIDVCIEEIRTADQIAADIEAKIVEAIKTGTSVLSEGLAEFYGVSFNNRSMIERSSLETSGREARSSSMPRSFSVSMALRSLQAKITAPIKSVIVSMAWPKTRCMASNSWSFICRLLSKKQAKATAKTDLRAADSEGVRDNA